MKTIYLDHNATTPLHPEVLEAMLPILKEHFGNPSSIHSQGRTARVRLDESREVVASLLGAQPTEIVFTSGGSESNNMAIKGLAWSEKRRGRHIVTSQIEHPSVLNVCSDLERLGFEVDYVSVDCNGIVDMDELQSMLRKDTALLSVQHANSEIGTLQNIQGMGEMARSMGIPFHVDAVQTVGKLPWNLADTPVDMLSLSAHKLYGPKGVGALFIRKGLSPLVPLISGGGQEKKRRGGTENVAGIVGLAKACELAQSRLENEPDPCLEDLRESLLLQIKKELPDVRCYGHPTFRLPNTLSLGFPGVVGESLMIALDMEGVSVSTGTACSSGTVLPSAVLTAMKLPEKDIQSIIRISMGWGISTEDLETVANKITVLVKQMRQVTQ